MIAVLGRERPATERTALEMLRAAPHRGERHDVATRGTCVLGVSRQDDFVDEWLGSCDGFTAAVHGRIDNARDILGRLRAAGSQTVDTEPGTIVAAAFAAFGPEVLRDLRGGFAGAVTNGTTLWCFRDHIGFRPLFYRDDRRCFVSASEAKQVVVGAVLPAEPDFDVLEHTFYGRLPSDAPSALKGVSRLAQATVIAVDSDRTGTPRRYWDPAALLETSSLRGHDLLEAFVDVTTQAVDRTLTGGDVISLSGGIDSPAVAAFAAPLHLERTGAPIGAMTAVFPNSPRVDELRYTALVAKHLGIPLHEYELKARALDDARSWGRLLDGPVPILSVPQVNEDCVLVKRLGFRNLLTGEFAEFVFAHSTHLLVHLLTHGRWAALRVAIARERGRGRGRRTLAHDLISPLLPPALLRRFGNRDRRLPARIPPWLDARHVERAAATSQPASPPWTLWRQQQLQGFHGSTVTMEADELCATRNSVTIRRPLADVDFWEFFLSLRAEVKFPDRAPKSLVRSLLRGRVPDEILDRRHKTVFDDHALRQIDYAALDDLLGTESNGYRMPGVDYGLLCQRMHRRQLDLADWVWARDLARIHAFASLW